MTVGIKNKQRALEKDFYVIRVNGKERFGYPGANRSGGQKGAGTIHGVYFGFCLVGEIMLLPSRSTRYL